MYQGNHLRSNLDENFDIQYGNNIIGLTKWQWKVGIDQWSIKVMEEDCNVVKTVYIKARVGRQWVMM